MMAKEDTEKFSIEIPSILAKLTDVEKLSEKVSRKAGLSEEDTDNLAIAVTEAVNNSIKHGNDLDTKKKVTVDFLLDPKKITVRICDEGGGFDPTNLDNPLDPENLLKESGRGIYILKAIMDKVDFKFTKTGTEVIMVKKR